MCKKALCTCKVVVFLIKTIVFFLRLLSRRRRRRRILKSLFREFKQRRFWAKHLNRKWAFFSFNKPWRYHICIATCLNSYRDDLRKNLLKITAQECKKSTSGWRASLLLKHPINMLYMLTWWGGHGDLRYCGIELLLFQVDFDNFSIFLTVLRY